MQETFNVTGMTCAACQANVTKAVSRVNGVSAVDVSLLGNSMKVDYDPDTVDPDTICQAVSNIGYGASLKGANKTEKNSLRSEWESRQKEAELQQKAAKKRLIWSVVLMIPLMYIAMGEMMGLPMIPILAGMENMMINVLVQIILSTIIMIIQRNFYIHGFKALIKRAPNMDSLVAVGSSASYVFAWANTLVMAYALGRMNMEMAHSAMMRGMYFDSAAMIVALVSVGKYLESLSKAKTGDALSKLVDLAPKQAHVIRNGNEITINSEEVTKGDIVVIRPGESIPVDGKVIEGVGYLDQSAITGESLPVTKRAGDEVISATINTNGTFRFEATKVGDDTTLAKIIRLVDDAGNSKAPIARVADKVAGVFVPIVIGIAAATLIIWMLLGADFTFALTCAISVLVVSCPCALGLATPVAIMVGTGKAAQYGILVKNAESLENLQNIDTIVLDKTGTITKGKMSVQDVLAYGTDQNKLIQIAGALEEGSAHPLAQAISEYARKKSNIRLHTEQFEELSGKGVKALVDGQMAYTGNLSFMKELGVEVTESVKTDMEQFASQGKTPILFADESKVIGMMTVSDTVRAASARAIREFKKKGIHTVMLTGDNALTAKAIAQSVGIDEVISEVLPADKESKVRSLQEAGRKVMMVGDGINDAPALMRADIGAAIGAGTDIAMDSADIILVKDSLMDVNTAIDLSRKVISNIHMNLFWAFFYNVIGIPIAAGLFYPVFGWQMSPMFGAAAMSLSSVCVCTNALRLRWFKPEVEVNEEVEEDPVIEEKSAPEIISEYQIEGMMCEHCVARVKKALESIDGVIMADVSLDKNEAIVHSTCEIDKSTVQKAVENAGYVLVDDTPVQKTIVVEGMMCEHCVNRVKTALEKVDGVKEADVHLEGGIVNLLLTKPIEDLVLKQAIEDAGYTMTEKEEEKMSEKVMVVEGMMCKNCAAHVKKALEGVDGVNEATIDLDAKKAQIKLSKDVAEADLFKAVEEAGYKPVSIE